MTVDLAERTMRTRALSRISGARDGRRFGQRFSADREADLLAYAATLPDEEILEWRNTGPAILRWIRMHQPKRWDEGSPFVPVTDAGKRLLRVMATVPPEGRKGIAWFVEQIETQARNLGYADRLDEHINGLCGPQGRES